MKHRIAEALRGMANKLDPPPPPPPRTIYEPRFVMPVISNEVAAQIGKRMRERMRATGSWQA